MLALTCLVIQDGPRDLGEELLVPLHVALVFPGLLILQHRLNGRARRSQAVHCPRGVEGEVQELGEEGGTLRQVESAVVVIAFCIVETWTRPRKTPIPGSMRSSRTQKEVADGAAVPHDDVLPPAAGEHQHGDFSVRIQPQEVFRLLCPEGLWVELDHGERRQERAILRVGPMMLPPSSVCHVCRHLVQVLELEVEPQSPGRPPPGHVVQRERALSRHRR